MALSTTQYGYIIDTMVPFTDGKGNTIKDGFVRVFVAGSSTPVITYRNFDGSANQDLIELDNSGRTKTNVIGSKGLTYKVCVYDQMHSQESPILTVDKVSVIGANITAGAGATVVTGLDGLRTKPDGFVDASVVGTDGYVALDHTLVTDDLNTDAKVTAVEEDRYIPLLNNDVNDHDSKITLGRLWQWVLGKIKNLPTTITAFRTGDVIPVDGPDGTAKMSKDDLLRETAENALSKNEIVFSDVIGYLKGDGTIYADASYHSLVSNKVSAKNGDVFMYRGVAQSATVSAVFYNSSGSVIGYDVKNSPNALTEITCPSNTASVKFASFASAGIEIKCNALRKGSTDNETENLIFDRVSTITSSIADVFDSTKANGPDGYAYHKGELVEYQNSVYVFKSDKTSGAWDSSKVSKTIALNELHFFEVTGYLNGDDTISSDSNYHSLISNKIRTYAGEVFLYRGVAEFATVSAIFYNSVGTNIGYSVKKSTDKLVEITCPANTIYVKFASYASANKDIQINVLRKGSSSAQSELKFLSEINRIDTTGSTAYANGFNRKEFQGYMQLSGTKNTSATYHSYESDYITASENDVFIYKGHGEANAASAIFYNSSKSPINYALKNSRTEFKEITCPVNTAFVKFFSYENVGIPIVLEFAPKTSITALLMTRQLPKNDKLSGKIWVSAGDSYTHGDFTGYSGTDNVLTDGIYAGQLAVYPYVIGNRTGAVVRNIAQNGLTLARLSPNADWGFVTPSTGLLYTTDFSDVDILTLYFGINDNGNNIALGDVSSTSPTEFNGAWNIALDYLISNYPHLKIGIIASNGCASPDYPSASKAMAEKWGIPCLDLDGGVGCTTMLNCSSRNTASSYVKNLRYTQQRVSSSNSHPNVLAHELESTFIEAWLKSL